MIRYFKILMMSGIVALAGCSDSKKSDVVTPKAQKTVRTDTASTDLIHASQGVIQSVHDAPVSSMVRGQIMQKLVKEGQAVRKGQILAVLDREEAMLNIKELERELEQAQYKLDEILIGQGYKRSEFNTVPERIRELARTKSGYDVCRQHLESARQLLQRTVLRAPIDGVCVDIDFENYQYVEPGKQLLHVINPNQLKIVFKILQTEMRRFEVGTVIKVSTLAYPEETHKARVSSINQQVGQDGMVRIEAVLEDKEHVLAGMSATVRL